MKYFAYGGLVVFAAIFIFLTSCSPVTPTLPTNIPPTPTPEPSAGKTVAFGQVIGMNANPLANMTVRLAEVYYDTDGVGAFVLNESFSPSALTDGNGVFLFSDLEPHDYVLIIGSMTVSYEVISEPNGDAKIFKFAPDQTYDLGQIETGIK